jgi:hypothetical protein
MLLKETQNGDASDVHSDLRQGRVDANRKNQIAKTADGARSSYSPRAAQISCAYTHSDSQK